MKERFIFDWDQLVTFCTKYYDSNIDDQTDSLLEVKLEELEDGWKKLKDAYEILMVSADTVAYPAFKNKAKGNFMVAWAHITFVELRSWTS